MKELVQTSMNMQFGRCVKGHQQKMMCHIILSLISKCCYRSQIVVMESQISTLKEDLEREQKKWRTAQDNYERQVPILPLRSRLVYSLSVIYL